MKKILSLTGVVFLSLAAISFAQGQKKRDSSSYPFGYKTPYENGFDGYGTYYGRGNGQLKNVPRYAPQGQPSRQHPSYQPFLNPYYRQYRPQPYLPYPYYYPQ